MLSIGCLAIWIGALAQSPAHAELPQNVTVVLSADGRRIDVDVANPDLHWIGVPPTGVLRVEFNNGRWAFMGSDFWVYAEGPTAIVFGYRKPAQDEETPNFVAEHFTELVWDRLAGIRPHVRYPAGIPPAAAPSLRRR